MKLKLYFVPFALSETLASANSLEVSTPSRTCDSDPLTDCFRWVRPQRQLASRSTLLICTRFHGPDATHSSFRKGGLQSGTNGITYASGNSCGCCPLFATAYPKQAPTLEFKQLTEKLKHNWKLSGDTSESLWSGLTTADGSINFTLIIYVAETLTNFFHLWSVHRRETMPKMFVHLPSVSICNVLGPLAGITLNTFLFHSDWRFGVSCLYAICVNSVCCIHVVTR